MAVGTQKFTYAEFLKLPETNQRCEVIDGALHYMTPAPTTEHQRISRNLFLFLHAFVDSHRLGEVLYAPLDVLIRQEPLRVRQPDLLFVSQQRQGIIGKQHIEGGPELVIEVLSPANSRADLDDKLADYWAIQVEECWLVSPQARTVEVLGRTESGFARVGLYGMGDVVSSTVLPALQVRVNAIW